MKFFYVEGRLVPAWKRLKFYHRKTYLPSVLRSMNFQQFLDRIQADSGLPNLYYPQTQKEFYYMQSPIPWPLQKDIDVFSPPLSCLGIPGVAGIYHWLFLLVFLDIFHPRAHLNLGHNCWHNSAWISPSDFSCALDSDATYPLHSISRPICSAEQAPCSDYVFSIEHSMVIKHQSRLSLQWKRFDLCRWTTYVFKDLYLL